MNKERTISYNDAMYIFHNRNFCSRTKLLGRWFLVMNNQNEGYIQCDYKWWAYILTFIPSVLIEFITCLWDGGIRDFRLPTKVIHCWLFTGLSNEGDETTFGRLKIIYNMAS